MPSTSCWLVLDFDTKTPDGAGPEVATDARAAAERDAHQAVEWINAAGGVVITDVSPSGGRHVLVPFAANESYTLRQLRPLLHLLKRLLPTLDTTPMLNPRAGCISLPGTTYPAGGFRELDGMTLADAIRALIARSAPGLVERLVRTLSPQVTLDSEEPLVPAPGRAYEQVIHSGLTPSATLPRRMHVRRPFPAWMRKFGRHGKWPERRRTPAGVPWTASEARLSVLEAFAIRGWSRQRTWDTIQSDPEWTHLWLRYRDRRDRHQLFAREWEQAFDHAHRRALAVQSATRKHQPVQLHTGGMAPALRPTLRHRLAEARKWILFSREELPGRQLWTALLIVQALAHGMALTGAGSAALGGRFLAVCGGLVSDRATWEVLQKLREMPGSPVRRLSRHTIDEGDRYTLVKPCLNGRQIDAADWEVHAARLDPVDAVWSQLTRSAWWIWTIMTAIEPDHCARLSRSVIAAAARVSVSSVDAALAELEEHSMVECGYGWAARTGRTVRDLGTITQLGDTRRAERISRHRQQRLEWKKFWGLVIADTELAELARRVALWGTDNAAFIDDEDAYTAAVLRSPPAPLEWEMI